LLEVPAWIVTSALASEVIEVAKRGIVWEPVGQRVDALPGGVVYLVPAVITEKSTAGEIAPGETVWAVRSAYSHG
jgi:hypothetical protein